MIGEFYTYTNKQPVNGSIHYFLNEIIEECISKKTNLNTENKRELLKTINSSVTDSNQKGTNDYIPKYLGNGGVFRDNIKNLVENLDIKDTTNDSYKTEFTFYYPDDFGDTEKDVLDSIFASISQHSFLKGKITVSDTEYGKKISIKTGSM